MSINMISVITPSLNQSGFIGQTIVSVLDQKVDCPVEYIIMDGESTDGTIDIVKKYEDRLSWFSSKDHGQSDALNKGISKASGEIIGWLNSDDIYLSGTLQKVADHFRADPSCQWLIGKCSIIDENGKEVRKALTAYKNLFLTRFSFTALLLENFISQPSVFFRKEAFFSLGALHNLRPLAMDYDLWLRFAKHYKPLIINDYLACFRVHHNAKSSLNPASQFREQVDIHKSYDKRKMLLFLHRMNSYKNVAGYWVMKRLKF